MTVSITDAPATEAPFTEALRLPSGPVDLAAIDTRATPAWSGDKEQGKASMVAIGDELADLQERLYAQGVSGGRRRMLLVLQGMDTSGKGGIVGDTAGMMSPQGLDIRSFKKPTEEERAHDFLWRIEKALPGPGMIGVFDRSHYEDVLIARVRGLAPAHEIERRYDAIEEFERRLVDDGVVLVKCMLHLSKRQQGENLLARLDDPTKHWKYNPGDLAERSRWGDYQAAYEIALQRCSTVPWLVVPADRKWYRKLAVAQILLEHLRAMDLQWPEADFDVETERAKLLAEAE